MNDATGIKIKNVDGKPVLNITSFEGMQRFHEIILMVLKNYIIKFYRKKEKQKTMDYLEVKLLNIKEYPSMFPENHEIIIKIPKLAEDIKDVKSQLEQYDSDENKIPESWQKWESFIVHLDNHLYTPLIIWKQKKEKIKSTPIKLNKGETDFVEHLKNFLNKEKNLFKDKELFLLRNLAKRGIGFFLSSGFYPDFILWVKCENKQHMVFIDPKGIRNCRDFNDEKIQLCTTVIKEIESKIYEDFSKNDKNIDLQLDAFIVSVSRYDDIKRIFGNGNHTKEEFEKHNILFQEDDKYIKKIFKKIGIIPNN